MQSRNVLVVGPGALGAIFAARLAGAGHEVTVACRTKATARHVEGHGVSATDPDGRRLHAALPALHRPKKLKDLDLLVLATKCSAAVPALDGWLSRIPEDTPVVGLQNGVMGETLRNHAGARYVPCTVAFPATLAGTAESVQTGPGGLHVGPWPQGDPAVHGATRAATPMLTSVAPVAQEENMLGVQWTKLLVNSCITSLGALTGQGLGGLLQDRRARQAFLGIVQEGYAAGRAAGIHFETVGGFRPALFARPVPGRHLILRAIGRKYRRHRSSSLQSMERGQRTEVDYLNGHIVATARRHGVAAPVNAAIVAAVQDMEENRAAPAREHLDRLPL